MKLSKRLLAVAGLVDSSHVLADIGTDHGYIPIYLVENAKCEKAIAMDVNKGPLLRAEEHISEYGFRDSVSTRLSDGFSALKRGECDGAVIAGMGGALTIKILTEGKEIVDGLKFFVLQPQSELYKVRAYLQDHGYTVVKEDMVEEDGKFYPMMKVVLGNTEPYSHIELLYGRMLLQEKNPTLIKFLEKEIRTKEEIISRIDNQERLDEIREELTYARAAYLRCT